METHRKGELPEAVVIAEFERRSIPVSLPFGDNERYDLVLETPDGSLLRVQVKTGWLSERTVQFHAESQHTNYQGNTYKSYDGNIDYFAVFCHELETLYPIREDEFGGSISLRVNEPSMENRRFNWATDFEIDERWPPGRDDDERSISRRESVTRVIDRLTSEGITVAKTIDSSSYQLVIEDRAGRLSRVRVKSGWMDNGRIRYAHDPIPDRIGYLAIYVPDRDGLYIVPRGQFNSSIVLRVDEPKKADSRINWAEAYDFPKNVPW